MTPRKRPPDDWQHDWDNALIITERVILPCPCGSNNWYWTTIATGAAHTQVRVCNTCLHRLPTKCIDPTNAWYHHWDRDIYLEGWVPWL